MDNVGSAFEIGGRAFNSFGDCCSWLASKAPGLIVYLGHWVDPFSMSSLAEAQTRDANAKLVHKSMLAKANLAAVRTRPASCSLFMTSFRLGWKFSSCG